MQEQDASKVELVRIPIAPPGVPRADRGFHDIAFHAVVSVGLAVLVFVGLAWLLLGGC